MTDINSTMYQLEEMDTDNVFRQVLPQDHQLQQAPQQDEAGEFDFPHEAIDEATNFTTVQLTFMLVALLLGATLSIVGSGTIIRIARRKLHEPYQRFLVGLCVADIISSASNVLQPFLHPQDEKNLHWARGNDKTCTLAGTNFVFSTMAVSLCNASLALYFYFSVTRSTFLRTNRSTSTSRSTSASLSSSRRGPTSSSNRNRHNYHDISMGMAEKFTHIFNWMFPLCFAILAAVSGVLGFQPELRLCVIFEPCDPETSEKECIDSPLYNPTIPIANTTSIGDNATTTELSYTTAISNLMVTIHLGTILICQLIGIVTTIAVYIHVRGTLMRSIKYTFGSDTTTSHQRNDYQALTPHAQHQLEQSFVQCLLYTLVFLNVLLWTAAAGFQISHKSSTRFVFLILLYFFQSSQGLFNFLVYIRPRIVALRKRYPDEKSYFILLRMAMASTTNQSKLENIRNHNSSSNNNNGNNNIGGDDIGTSSAVAVISNSFRTSVATNNVDRIGLSTSFKSAGTIQGMNQTPRRDSFIKSSFRTPSEESFAVPEEEEEEAEERQRNEDDVVVENERTEDNTEEQAE